ncbi:unnamed protein product, partial [Larinioides sclopetarius]
MVPTIIKEKKSRIFKDFFKKIQGLFKENSRTSYRKFLTIKLQIIDICIEL